MQRAPTVLHRPRTSARRFLLLFALLLFGLAWLGHACLLMVIVNFTYAHPLHRKFLKAFRLFMGLVIFISPAVYAVVVGYDLLALIQRAETESWLWPSIGWMVLCIFTAVILLPWVTVQRLLRKNPTQVISEQTTTVDIAKELGGRPIGDGKYRKTAAWSFNQCFHVDFTTLTIALPDLPESWDGLTLLQISDLHFIGTPDRNYFTWIFQRAMAEGIPDLLLITGDLVDTRRHHRWILPLLGKLQWNIAAFAILGNHDWWQNFERIRRRLRRLKMHVVSNCWENIEVRGQRLTVIGHEGPWFKPYPDLKDCPTDGFRLLLSHTPDNIGWARHHGVRLMLSGHNHGGQVRLPVFGSIFVPSKFSRRYDMGTFFEAPTLLHVNRGLSGKEPLRIRCNPQITRIILRRVAPTPG